MTQRALIVGDGRMGRTVQAVWRERGHGVVARLGRGDAWPQPLEADVAFEFTEPESAGENVRRLLAAGVPTVCGTTGWDPSAARRVAGRLGVPLMAAANFSVGVTVLRGAVAGACRRLRGLEGWEGGLVERHHAGKRDAPSGTAGSLAGLVEELTGERPPVASLRQGRQPGEHRLVFEGTDEEVELSHRARSRRAFADGAARAGEWLARRRPPGPVAFREFVDEAAPERSADDA